MRNGSFPRFLCNGWLQQQQRLPPPLPAFKGAEGVFVAGKHFRTKEKREWEQSRKEKEEKWHRAIFSRSFFFLGNPQQNNPNPTICRIGLWPPAHLHHHRWCPKSKSPRRLTNDHFLNNPPSTSGGRFAPENRPRYYEHAMLSQYFCCFRVKSKILGKWSVVVVWPLNLTVPHSFSAP